MDKNTVPDVNTFKQVRPVALYTRLETHAETPNTIGMEVTGDSYCPDSHHTSVCYVAENTKPHHTWKRHFLLEFTMGHPSGIGELHHTPG